MKNDVWVFLFILGFVLFSWPVITIFSSNLPRYFFTAWLLLIGLIYLASRTGSRKDGGS